MIRKHLLGTKLVNWINNSFDKPRKIYNKINSSPVNINNLVKYKDEYDNIFMDLKLLKAVDNYMIKKNVGLPQRQAILYTIWLEGSKIGPHGNGASGLVGWRGLRAKGLPNTIEGLAEKLYNETFGSFNSNNWNHGGDGSGYKSGKEALQAFLNAKTYSDAVRALNYGYVRPDPDSLLKRITSNVFRWKKGGRVLKFLGGNPIVYKLDSGYNIDDKSFSIDEDGYLRVSDGTYGSMTLPEVIVNGKGNITTLTLLKRLLPETENDVYNLASFLGYSPKSSEDILKNESYIPSRKLSDEEIDWYNKYILDKFRRRQLFRWSDGNEYEYAEKVNKFNKYPTNAMSLEDFINKFIGNIHNLALKDLINYYNSKEYKQRLDRIDPALKKALKPMTNVPFDITSTQTIGGKNTTATSNFKTGTISYNKDYIGINNFPYETSTHELSHLYELFFNPIINSNGYNNKYIKLNPYLSKDDKAYYGKPTEIRARAMEVLMDYLNNKSKYKSLEDFINKNLKHPTVRQLRYTFKDDKSLFDYMNNFVQNDTNPVDEFKNWYAKQGGKLL